MNIEDLTSMGLTPEQAKSVKDLFKKELDGKYIPKDTFDAERQKVKDRDAQIAERDKQITELGRFKGDSESLTKKIQELTEKNETALKEYQTKIQKMEFETAIRSELSDKVHDFSDVLGKLDTTIITVRDGKVVAGLDEQVKALQESHPYYFKSSQGATGGFKPVGATPQNGGRGESAPDYETFAAKLAEVRSQQTPVQQKVAETYFGETSK